MKRSIWRTRKLGIFYNFHTCRFTEFDKEQKSVTHHMSGFVLERFTAAVITAETAGPKSRHSSELLDVLRSASKRGWLALL